MRWPDGHFVSRGMASASRQTIITTTPSFIFDPVFWRVVSGRSSVDGDTT
jgi:hypothetical protein